MSGFVSRPATNKAPAQRSQATFRSSSFKKQIGIKIKYYKKYFKKVSKSFLFKENSESDDDGDDNYDTGKNNVLLTELGEDAYDESSDELDFNDDDDVEFRKTKKKLPPIIFKNDIDNEKDYDTDLDDEDKKTDEETNNPRNVYIKMCESLKVIPCRYFMAHIEKQKLTMKYHQFSDDEVRAIAKPLWVSPKKIKF